LDRKVEMETSTGHKTTPTRGRRRRSSSSSSS